MKKSTKTILAIVGVVLLIAAMAAAWLLTRPETSQGAKAVTVQVVHMDGTEKEEVLHTDAEFLGQALQESKTLNILSEDGPYGIYITSVDGEAASDEAQTYWCISKDGEMLMVGADQQPIADGEHYELVLTKW